jgi:hypothetical protein
MYTALTLNYKQGILVQAHALRYTNLLDLLNAHN